MQLAVIGEVVDVLESDGGGGAWMASSGLDYDGPCREVYFADWDTAGPDDAVCDVAFPVR